MIWFANLRLSAKKVEGKLFLEIGQYLQINTYRVIHILAEYLLFTLNYEIALARGTAHVLGNSGAS